MIIRMENAEGLSLPQMAALLGTRQDVRFAAKGGRRSMRGWNLSSFARIYSAELTDDRRQLDLRVVLPHLRMLPNC